MNKFLENSETKFVKIHVFFYFLAYSAVLISINWKSVDFQTYGTFVELNGFNQVLKLIEGNSPLQEKSAIKCRQFLLAQDVILNRLQLFDFSSYKLYRFRPEARQNDSNKNESSEIRLSKKYQIKIYLKKRIFKIQYSDSANR